MHPWVTHPLCHGAVLNPQGPEKWMSPQVSHPNYSMTQPNHRSTPNLWFRRRWLLQQSILSQNILIFLRHPIFYYKPLENAYPKSTSHHPSSRPKKMSGKRGKGEPLELLPRLWQPVAFQQQQLSNGNKTFPTFHCTGWFNMGSLCHTDSIIPL